MSGEQPVSVTVRSSGTAVIAIFDFLLNIFICLSDGLRLIRPPYLASASIIAFATYLNISLHLSSSFL